MMDDEMKCIKCKDPTFLLNDSQENQTEFQLSLLNDQCFVINNSLIENNPILISKIIGDKNNLKNCEVF